MEGYGKSKGEQEGHVADPSVAIGLNPVPEAVLPIVKMTPSGKRPRDDSHSHSRLIESKGSISPSIPSSSMDVPEDDSLIWFGRYGLTNDEIMACEATPSVDLKDRETVSWFAEEIDNCVIRHEWFELAVLLFQIGNSDVVGVMHDLHKTGIISRVAGMATGNPLKKMFPNDTGVDLCMRVSRLLVVSWKTRMRKAAAMGKPALSPRSCSSSSRSGVKE